MLPTRFTNRQNSTPTGISARMSARVSVPRRMLATVAALSLALLGLGVGLATPAAAAGGSAGPTPFGCNAATSPGVMHCLGYTSDRRAERTGNARSQTTGSSTTVGYIPSQLRSAYNLTATGSSSETVAIVDAYNDPNAASDLATYRSAYGLAACTAASGCFKQESETGTSSLPSTDYGWSEEESLDLDMVSAICPGCHILLVEASSATEADLDTAENTAAATSGVVAISNSWAAPSPPARPPMTRRSTTTAWRSPRAPATAATARSARRLPVRHRGRRHQPQQGLERPRLDRIRVVDVVHRGHRLRLLRRRGAALLADSLRLPAGCSKRIVADVSAVADPATGVAVYDTANSCGTSSWATCSSRWAWSPAPTAGSSRRHQRRLPHHRLRLRPGRQHLRPQQRLLPLQPHLRPQRRDLRLHQHLHPRLPLHRRTRLRRPHRPRHPERNRGVLRIPLLLLRGPGCRRIATAAGAAVFGLWLAVSGRPYLRRRHCAALRIGSYVRALLIPPTHPLALRAPYVRFAPSGVTPCGLEPRLRRRTLAELAPRHLRRTRHLRDSEILRWSYSAAAVSGSGGQPPIGA